MILCSDLVVDSAELRIFLYKLTLHLVVMRFLHQGGFEFHSSTTICMLLFFLIDLL